MFTKKNTKLIAVLVIVSFIGLLSFLLLQNEEASLKGDALHVENKPEPGKVSNVPVVDKNRTVVIANIADNIADTQNSDMRPAESTSMRPLQAPLNSLADARINGDPRTPPIVRSTIEREMPTPEELADPDLYQEYEIRQNQKVYRSFYSASKNKLVKMEKLMEQARSQGVSEDKLREGEEKIAKMKAMREKLAQTYNDISDEQ